MPSAKHSNTPRQRWLKLFLALVSFTLGLPHLHAAGFPWNRYARQPDAWFGGPDAKRVAANVLAYQTANGGWPKNIDTGAPPLQGAPTALSSTFDNSATRGELRFLARAYRHTGEEVYRRAFLKGLDLILTAQYSNGGWPQSHPPGTGYARHITFNDGTMIGLLEFLRDVVTAEDFAFVDPARRSRARQCVDLGIDCILRCQIKVDGIRTAWCAQHDAITLAPRPARSYEHASISGGESAGVCLFLMSIDDPSPRIVEAVTAACRWFQEVQIRGIRLVRTEQDRWIVEDPDADPLWARFYEIGSNRPIFSGRDGVIRYALAEIELERRLGYSWYVTAPASVLAAWPAWTTRHPVPK